MRFRAQPVSRVSHIMSRRRSGENWNHRGMPPLPGHRQQIERHVMIKQATGVAIAALLLSVPALAESGSSTRTRWRLAKQAPAPPIQAPASRARPTRAPARRPVSPRTGSGSGASAGEAGSDTEHATTPSQDSSGVEGLPGNKSGAAAKEPSGSDAASKKKAY